MKNANVIKNNNELKKVLSEIGHIENLYIQRWDYLICVL